jgi:hypothetical protein
MNDDSAKSQKYSLSLDGEELDEGAGQEAFILLPFAMGIYRP